MCVSRAVAEELHAGWGIRATVIPNGVDAARFTRAASSSPAAAARRREWRRRLGGGPLVLTVGGVEPRKGSLELLEAFALLRRRWPAARLAVAGGETLLDYRDYRARFDARCAEPGQEGVVLGPVADPELPALVAADAFAPPSAKEGFGLAAMEALAAGVPLVLSDRPVFREVYCGCAQFAGTVEELGEALDCAVAGRDPERRRRGEALAASHTWAAAAAHVALYERLLSRRT